MTIFLDGPAENVSLPLRRAPIFLRVVRSKDGRWDALDQLDDEPASGETVHVYILKDKPGMMHVRASRGASGFYAIAQYQHLCEQPGDEHTRANAAWAAWVDSHHRLVPPHLLSAAKEP